MHNARSQHALLPGKDGQLRTQVVHAQVEFCEQELAHPLVISSGAITQLTEARVQVTVRTAGKVATGRGSIFLSDLWAWPDSRLSHEHRDQALRRLCQRIARNLAGMVGDAAHPLELGLRLHATVCVPGPDEPPALAQAMCLSPFDAAIHDAVGIATRRSAFAFYDADEEIPSADTYFGRDGAAPAIRALLRQAPLDELPAWYLVGRNDNLERDVQPWAVDRGYRCFKLKILAKDCQDDVERTVEVFRKVRDWCGDGVSLSVDSNEGHPDAEAVLEYLSRLKEADLAAFSALKYLEQPTSRDIVNHPQDWRGVTALKPVLLDEGLTHLHLLPTAQAQGWSGLALKTCKGHSFALVAAAWAKQHGLLLAMQDLTNPGYSAIHSALFAAYVPTINGVELNSPQFTPSASAQWLPPRGKLEGLFAPTGGVHRLPRGYIPGLGSML